MRVPACLLVGAILQAQAPALSPWRFGMSKAEVTSFAEFGPYHDVKSTGGTETFRALFNGKRTNVSFLFDGKGLKRIQVWAYEGRGRDDAARAWAELHAFLVSAHGPVRIPALEAESRAGPAPHDGLAARAIALTEQVGKVQMAPEKMPPGASVFSSLVSRDYQGSPYYYLFLYLDRP